MTTAVLTVDQVAERLGISRSMFYELIGRRELRSLTVGARRLIPESAIVEFIERRVA